MKNFYLLAWMLFLVSSAQTSVANHLLGGEIAYKFISSSGNSQVYEVTLSLYGDCSSNSTDPEIGSAFSALRYANPEITLLKSNTLITAQRLQYDTANSNIEITPVCPDEAGNTACIMPNNPLPGIKKFMYRGRFTLTGTDTNWTFMFLGTISDASQAGRSSIIQNIANPNSASNLMYLEATLNNTTGPNSSTTFTSPPTPFFCRNKNATYNLGAADAENDELLFSLMPGKSVLLNPPPYAGNVFYILPLNFNNPLPSAAGNFNFNTANGNMTFIPNEVKNCLVVNRVEEFRNGVKVGSTMREMTFIILDNCNNDAPNSPVSGIANADIVVESPEDLVLSVCEGQVANISFDIQASDPNGDNITITYSNLQPGATLTIDNDGTGDPVAHFEWNVMDALPGSYIFYITYTDDGCPLVSTKTVSYTVKIVPHPYGFTGGTAGACTNLNNGKAWVLPDSGNNLSYHYRWVGPAGTTLKDVQSTVGDTLSNIAAGVYKVYIRNDEGCGTNVIIEANEPPLPAINLLSDTTVCTGIPIEIKTAVQNEVNYLWNTGDTSCCITVTESGRYILTASSLCGEVSDSTAIRFTKCNFCLFVPNAFSPNGDGQNDKFNILETCLIDKFLLQIFNRWGQLVFSTLSSAKSWDGTYEGTPVTPGTYFYRISATPGDKSKGQLELKGDITLIR